MGKLRGFAAWARALLRRGASEAEMDEELRFHVEMETEKNRRAGMDPAEARRQALIAFGAMEAHREELRTGRRAGWLEDAALDLRYAGRTLLRSPGFTLVAVLTIALGVGASTAIFSVVDSVLLRPLPYPEPDRLVQLTHAWDGEPEGELSPAEYFDYRERLESFSRMGVYATGPVNVTGGEVPERLEAGYLSAGTFPTLGVAPALGRTFSPAEDAPGGDAVAVLSHGLWTRRFGAARDVIGTRIVLGGSPVTVIGVMPPEFRLPTDLAAGEAAEIYVPLGIDRATIPNRGSHFLNGVARLRPGVSVEAGAREVAAMAAAFVREFPDEYPEQMQFSATAQPLAHAVLGDVRPVMWVLAGAVGFVLLIACANVASLLLARADRRQRELSVRAALGAGRGRLVRQLFLESLVLALVGGAAGLLLAVGATEALPLLHPPSLPRLHDVRVDPGVLVFALGASLASALLFGLAPALHSARAGIHATLKEGGRGQTAGSARHRFRSVLVAAEIALAVVLLLGAGLLMRSLLALYRVDPGFRTEHVLTMGLSLPAGDYPGADEVVPFYRELTGRIEALPGVRAVGAVTNLPLTGTLGDLNFQIEGREVPEGGVSPRADWQVVTPGYFDAVGMRLLRGRGIEPRDDREAPGAAVINQALAEQYWPGEDPIGERLLLGGGAGPGWVTVVGVVGDVRHAALSEPPRPEYYLPHAQFRFWNGGEHVRSMTITARTRGEPMELAAAIRREIRALDPNLPISEVRTLEQVRAESVAQPRFLSVVLGAFAAVALLLAVVGIYGTLAYLVSQRTHEIGIRMALGAHTAEITRMVVGRGVAVGAAGVAVGLAGALALTRVLAHLLFGVTTTDPVTYVVVPVVLIAAALLASYLPARRAARVDPMVALRAE